MNQEFKDAFASDTPPATGEKSEAELMREQADAEYADGWGMFPESGDETPTGAESTPVRTGDAAATEIKPMGGGSSEMSFVDALAKAKAAGQASFTWNGRSFETGGTEREMSASTSTTSKPRKPSAPVPTTNRPNVAPRQAEVLSEEEADARQLAPARSNVNSPTNVWPNNRPSTNIYANAGPTVGASPQTQAARTELAANLNGKNSMADVMKGARK